MIVCSPNVDVKDDKARVPPPASRGVIVGGSLPGQTLRWYPIGKPSQNIHFEHGLLCTAAVWCHDDGNNKVFHLKVVVGDFALLAVSECQAENAKAVNI